MLKLFQSIYQILNQNGVVLVILLEGNGEQYVTEPLDPTILEFVNFYQSKEIEAIMLIVFFIKISSFLFYKTNITNFNSLFVFMCLVCQIF